MQYLLTAIVLGFLGSFHCVGMCGPIAMALPVHNKPALVKHALIVLYNFGRIITYSFFGFVAGIVGSSFSMAGWQQGFSISVGVLLLLAVFLPKQLNFTGINFFVRLKSAIGAMFSKGTRSSLFVIGLLNGLLPCGLVYLGIAGAAVTGSVLKGALFMAAFGLGTLPAMWLLPLAGGIVTLGFRNTLRKAIPVLVTSMALILILRGLNLGIPYLSPKLNSNGKIKTCHVMQPHKLCYGKN